MKYKGYEITTGESIFGAIGFTVRPLPGTKSCFYSATCWSLADAKRTVRIDIKQAHCAHDAGFYQGKQDKRYFYCELCDKIMSRDGGVCCKDLGGKRCNQPRNHPWHDTGGKHGKKYGRHKFEAKGPGD